MTFVLSLFYNFFFFLCFVFTRIFKKAFLNFWMGRHMGLQQAGGIAVLGNDIYICYKFTFRLILLLILKTARLDYDARLCY